MPTPPEASGGRSPTSCAPGGTFVPTTQHHRTGPFLVEWLEPVPNKNGKLARAGCKRRFQDLPEAVRFVMQAVPEASRATALISAAVGLSLQFDEILARYDEPAAERS